MPHMKRLFGIRHLRWLWLSFQVKRWAQQCAALELGLGFPNEEDIDAIWRGEA